MEEINFEFENDSTQSKSDNIQQENNVTPQENNSSQSKKDNKKPKFSWWMLVVAIVGCILFYSAFSSLTKTESKPKLEISPTTWTVEYYSSLDCYSATINGTARNTTSKNYAYASVEFAVYDSNGNNLGTAIANINNLLSGDSWNFSATLISFPNTEPTSYKLVDITAW